MGPEEARSLSVVACTGRPRDSPSLGASARALHISEPGEASQQASAAKHDRSASAKPAHQRRIRRAHCRRRDARDPASIQPSPSLIRCCATGSTERSARTAARPRPPRRTLQRLPRRTLQRLRHPRGPLEGGGTTPLQGPGLVRSGTEGGPARAGVSLQMGPIRREAIAQWGIWLFDVWARIAGRSGWWRCWVPKASAPWRSGALSSRRAGPRRDPPALLLLVLGELGEALAPGSTGAVTDRGDRGGFCGCRLCAVLTLS